METEFKFSRTEIDIKVNTKKESLTDLASTVGRRSILLRNILQWPKIRDRQMALEFRHSILRVVFPRLKTWAWSSILQEWKLFLRRISQRNNKRRNYVRSFKK